ncbi:hypothetical protein GTP27_18235 [Pseudoduganella sp. CY13W]|uniref:GPI inositol-deacylase PGAP1-like alpha/beta domain-containing protein n=1 Tax=Duganella qianjiadongensis TaxID=2692176 RepID=A0ABW9VRW1_9BURK|nr:hypothetical protein [Duganella qianjiadongensis]
MPPKKVIPIIFIPGIMGSNLRMTADRQALLKKKNNIAWRVDSTSENAHFMALNAADRQKQLDPDKTSVDTFDSGHSETGNPKETTFERNKAVNLSSIDMWHVSNAPLVLLLPDPPGVTPRKTHQHRALERGWGEVLYDSYGELLQLMEKQLNDAFCELNEPSIWWKKNVLDISPQSWGAAPENQLKPIRADELKSALTECWFPVHAMGYNWLQSNRASGSATANRIRALIKKYADAKFDCRKVILITHSMGGLVARAAMHSSIGKIEDLVLGAVHSVMPALGAAITYKRMRCGFEGGPANIPKRVLGYDGHEVTAVLSNSPGGLELLPTKNYGNSWLKIVFDNTTLLSLPQKNNPITEIYKIQNKWYQLFNPEWINPAKLQNSQISRTFEYIDLAEKFHKTISNYYHKNSYAIYGSDKERLTWGEVVWQFDQDVSSLNSENFAVSSDSENGKIKFEPINVLHIPKFNFHNISILSPSAHLVPPKEQGDETVPIRSANNQDKFCKAIFRQKGYEHQDSLKYQSSVSATFYSIIRIIQEMNWSKT